MFEMTEENPISPALRALLEVFSGELAEVRFPDVDGGVLAGAAEQVRERAEAVARAHAALEVARQALYESQEALQAKGLRAYAYAKVYAEDDAALSAKLDGILLSRPARKVAKGESESTAEGEEAAPKRRGRPPKARASAPLFNEGATPPVEAPGEAAPAEAVRPAA